MIRNSVLIYFWFVCNKKKPRIILFGFDKFVLGHDTCYSEYSIDIAGLMIN